MELTTSDFAVVLVVIAVGVGSLATLARLAAVWFIGRPFLPWEPRRPVPWNGWAPLVVLAPLASVWGKLLVGEAPSDPSATLVAGVTHAAATAVGLPQSAALSDGLLLAAARELTERPSLSGLIALQGAVTIAIAAGGYLILTLAFKATRHDLGVPDSWSQLWGDVRIGFVACLASMLPIWLILNVISRLTGTTEEHPLIRELTVNHSTAMMTAAAFTAIVAAPLYEETAFRLIFQGWLEKLFTKTNEQGSLPTPSDDLLIDSVADASLSRRLTAQRSEPRDALLSANTLINWPPILISGVLFGLAHLGHGASPAPLVLLGFVHGYLYQRTHRIVAPIACHMLFNSITVLILALHFGG